MTVAASTLQRSPVAPPAAGRWAAEAWHLRLVTLLVVLLVLTQRIGIPLGDEITSLATPLAYGFVALSLSRQMLVVSWIRAGLLTLAVSACLLTTAAVSWLGLDSQFSMTSLLLLIVLYVPWVMRGRAPHGAAIVARAGRTFVWTMLALSAVGMAQLAAQLVGVWEYEDYLAEFVPEEYLIRGYNFANELAWDVGIYKSTAFVMLEPSFLSQFCALAILVGIMLRVRTWQLFLLAGGLASAVSGTGLVLLAAGGLLLLVRAPRLLRVGYVLAGAVVSILVLRSPVAQFLVSRGDEVATQGTSADARFVAPYLAAWEGLNDQPARFLVGGGPGSVDRVIPGDRITANGTDILYGVIPKLAFEYGILAGGLFVLFLLLALIDRAPWRVVPGSLVVMLFLLSGALLQPQTAYLAWLLAGIGASDGPRQDRLASG